MIDKTVFNQLSMKDYLSVLLKHKYILFSFVSIACLIALVYAFIATPVYEAGVKLLFVAENRVPMPSSEKLSSMRFGLEYAFIQKERIKTNTIMSEVVDILDLHKRGEIPGIIPKTKRYISNKIKYWINEFRNIYYYVILKKAPKPKRYLSKFEKTTYNLAVKNKLVKVIPVDRTDMIIIFVKDHEPDMAAKIANTIAYVYIMHNMRLSRVDLKKIYRERHPRIIKLNEEINLIKKELKKGSHKKIKELVGKEFAGNIKIIHYATPAIKPIKPKKKLILIAAFILSLILGIAYIFLLEALNKSIKYPRDIFKIMDKKALYSLPIIKKGINKKMFISPDINNRNLKPYFKALKSIASQICFMIKKKNIQSLMINSVEDKEGKSLIALSLAKMTSEILNKKVLLIDTNIRKPGLHKFLGCKNDIGFVDFIKGNVAKEEIIKSGIIKNVDIIFAGNAGNEIESLFFKHNNINKINELKSGYSLVLMDAVNLKNYKDALFLSDFADESLFIIKTNSTRTYSVQIAAEELKKVNMPILGVILNFRKFYISSFLYKNI